MIPPHVKGLLSATEQGNSCDRQPVVHQCFHESKPAVTDVTPAKRQGHILYISDQPQPESHCCTEAVFDAVLEVRVKVSPGKMI